MDFKKNLQEALTIKFDQAFGLDISDRSVEIVELQKVFSFSVITYGRTELPTGVVENGLILDQNALALKVKTLLKEAKPRKVSTNKVVISLPESQVFIQCIVVDSKLKFGALNQAIIDKISTILPISLDKIYWDFMAKPLPDKTKKLIIFVGVVKGVANSYVKFCNSIGLEVVSLSVESLSLARVILKKSDRQSLIIDIGARTTNLGFFDSNDRINMSITIPQAGDNFTNLIKESLKLESPEAEALKIKFGFKEDKDNTVKPIITPVLEDILAETQKAIEYYEETFKQKLDDVYLIGGSSLLPGMAEVVKKNLGKEIKQVVNGNNVNLKFLSGKGKEFSIFANVIGLGMLGSSAQFHDVNLLKKMPSSEVNVVDKLNLLKTGYLSPINAIRTILNNKYILVLIILLIGVIFAVLLQQAQNFGFASAYSPMIDNGF
jgi:type IV pilus assembly protein PilM